MNNWTRLYEILSECTVQLRKGPVVVIDEDPALVEKRVMSAHIFNMPHVDDPALPEIEKVDVHFMVIGVERNKAQAIREELIGILGGSLEMLALLAQGPSYIAVGGLVGDQGAALQLFALGQVLKFWTVITPALLGLTGPDADKAAGAGFVMVDGYKP